MDPKEIAKQLRKPEGLNGKVIAEMMNGSNLFISKKTYENLEPNNNDKVLEIGFASGQFISHLFTLADNLVYKGIDISRDMIELAKKNLAKANLESQIELRLASVSSIPFEDNTFNKICSANTIYFWDDPKADVRELYRVLKPGGKLVLAYRPKDTVKDLPFAQYGFTFYYDEEINNLLLGAGFIKVLFETVEEPEVEFNNEKHKIYSTYAVCEK